MEERINTLHPENKSGVNIRRDKYDMVRGAIKSALSGGVEITFSDLTVTVNEKLADIFDGSIPWYVTTVKLDMEARGLIERVKGSKPQRLRWAAKED